MEYKGYIITNGKVIKKGDSRKKTKGVNIDEINSIEKTFISKKKLLGIGVLSLVLVVSLTGVLPSPFQEIGMVGSSVFIAATLLSAFVTDRYVIKTRNEKIAIPARGSKGKAFVNEIQKKAGHSVDSDVAYGTQNDPFVDSGRQVQLNVAAVLLIVFGSLLAIGIAGPMYSDDITWEKVTDVVEAVNSDGGEGNTLVAYQEKQEDKQRVFESEYATVEFSQGQEDLDATDSRAEKYVTIEMTVESSELIDAKVQIREPQRGDNFRSFANVVDNGSWASYGRLTGEIERETVDGTVLIPIGNEEHIGITQTVGYRPYTGALAEDIQISGESGRFVKGFEMDDDYTSIDEADSPDEVEAPGPSNLIGLQQGENVRVVGTTPETSNGELEEVILANYTVK